MDQSDTPDGRFRINKEIQDMSVGVNHTCAIIKDFDNYNLNLELYLKCWGNNLFGQLGVGDFGNNFGDEKGESPVNQEKLISNSNLQKIASGRAHTCALLKDGSVNCWGDNFYGQLGLGHTQTFNYPVSKSNSELRFSSINLGKGEIKDIKAGSDFTCVLFAEGKVKCWGANFFGQLGIGDKRPRGVKPDEMGENLPFLKLGTSEKIFEISVGGDHACGRTNSGKVICWGLNQNGQLGVEDKNNRGDSENDINHPVNLGKNRRAIKIFAGGAHSCALLDNGLVKCWGRNSSGELGLGNNLDKGVLPGDMGDNLKNVDLAVAVGDLRSILDLALGEDFSCAILNIEIRRPGSIAEKNVIKCWGNNIYGQLGLGDTENRGDGPNEMGINLPNVNVANSIPSDQEEGFENFGGANRIFSSGHHICAIGNDVKFKKENDFCIAKPKTPFLRCWGANIYGQLGLGGTLNIGSRRLVKENGCYENLPGADPDAPEGGPISLDSEIPEVPF